MRTSESETRRGRRSSRPTPPWEAWTEWQPEDLADTYWPPRQGPRAEGEPTPDRDGGGAALVAVVS